MGKASTGFFVPTTGSSVQVETVGFTPASGFQDLAVRSLGIGGPASGTAGQLTGPTNADLVILAGGTNNAVLQAGNAGTRTGGYVKAFYGTTDGSVACVPGAAIGANLTGGALTLQEGQGTGTGTGGGINFYTVPIGASGSGLNATALTSTLTGIQNNLAGTAQVWRIFPTFADGGVTSAAGMQTLSVNPTINCTAASRTGNYVALAVSVNETSLPTGPNYLLLLQAGAVGSVTKFSVDNTGAVLVGGTLTTANNAALAQGFTTGGLILPLCSTGAPSGAAANGNIVVGGDNNLWARMNGAWVQVNGGTTPTLGAVVNAGNTVNGTSVSKGIAWTTGGTFTVTAAEILGPTDTGLFISSGTPTVTNGNGLTLTASDGILTGPGATSGGTITATAGRGATNAATPTGFGAVLTLNGASSTGAGGLASLVGGAGSTGTNNNAAGGATMDSGASSGTGTGQLLFKVPAPTASGAGANASATVLTIDPSGCVYVGRQNVTTVGAVSFTASQGGSTSGAGGNASLIGGAAGTAGGATGTANLTGGANAIASGSTAGGQVNITGGACSGTTSTGAGGAFVAAGGLGGTTSGTGGAASVTGGAGQGSTSGVGGLASLVGGAGSTGSSNNASGGCLLSTGVSSGTGFSNITARTSFTLATGSTAQTIGDRLMICGKTLVLSNTTGTATAFASLSTTSGAGLGGTCFYTVVASDGTEWSSASGQFDFSVVNKAGTLTTAAPLIQTENIANSTGATLATTGTPTVVASGTAVLLKVTPAFSGTNAAGVTSCKVSWEIVLRGSVSTVTPQ